MSEFKDKLFKVKKQKLDPLEVIFQTYNDYNFCDWLAKNLSDLRARRIFSLKRIARMYLADNPGIYSEFQMNSDLEKEKFRIIQDKSFWEDDD